MRRKAEKLLDSICWLESSKRRRCLKTSDALRAECSGLATTHGPSACPKFEGIRPGRSSKHNRTARCRDLAAVLRTESDFAHPAWRTNFRPSPSVPDNDP